MKKSLKKMLSVMMITTVALGPMANAKDINSKGIRPSNVAFTLSIASGVIAAGVTGVALVSVSQMRQNPEIVNTVVSGILIGGLLLYVAAPIAGLSASVGLGGLISKLLENDKKELAVSYNMIKVSSRNFARGLQVDDENLITSLNTIKAHETATLQDKNKMLQKFFALANKVEADYQGQDIDRLTMQEIISAGQKVGLTQTEIMENKELILGTIALEQF